MIMAQVEPAVWLNERDGEIAPTLALLQHGRVILRRDLCSELLPANSPVIEEQAFLYNMFVS
jgi:hypothetical protein